jgi:hypothetical protein
MWLLHSNDQIHWSTQFIHPWTGSAMVQAVSHRPLTLVARVSLCRICGGQNDTGTGLSLSSSVFPVSIIRLGFHTDTSNGGHSSDIVSPHPHEHQLPWTLYNICNFIKWWCTNDSQDLISIRNDEILDHSRNELLDHCSSRVAVFNWQLATGVRLEVLPPDAVLPTDTTKFHYNRSGHSSPHLNDVISLVNLFLDHPSYIPSCPQWSSGYRACRWTQGLDVQTWPRMMNFEGR